MPSGFLTACVLATDGERPDHYEFPICTIVLCFPEVLLSLNTLYLGIQLVAASMNKYFVVYAV
jgi:hypothetical protein